MILGAVITTVETQDVADDAEFFGLDLGLRTAFAFLVGAACSMASGIIGMFISVKANVRTASAAQRSLVEAVQVAMRGGAVSGFLVVALSLLGVSGIFALYSAVHRPRTVAEAPFLIVGFGFGASFVALFAQLGGGIYTKAADVGSDLVGKVEAGIPEDDPRNAGVVADLVGDNVGDCAGRGADLFESTAAENIGAMILGVAVYTIAVRSRLAQPRGLDLLPARRPRLRPPRHDRVDPFFVRGTRGRGPDEHPQPRLLGDHDPVRVVGLLITTNVMMSDDGPTPAGSVPTWLWFFAAASSASSTSVAFVYITQYYTAGSYRPGPGDRRGIEDRSGHEHHLGHGGRLRDDLRHRDHDRHRAVRQPLARLAGRHRQRERASTSAASSGRPSRRWAC